jgi:competence protein ComEC
MVRLASRKNPGEFDLAAYWHDRGVHALVHVRQGDAGVKRLSDGWVWSISGWLGRVRGAAHDLLEGSLKNEISTALARALLLGEGAPLTHDDWGMFVRTGVIHVLAISGQHLVVVAWFLWIAAQLFGVRQRHAAMVVPLVLVTYALVTGGRPPAIRAAVGASAVCVGLVIGRPAMPANLFALAWLVVGIWRPADYFEAGCQLSFLAVAILCWGASWVLMREEDPLAEVVERSRPVLVQGLRWVGQKIFESYLVCFIVWVGITPLAAFHTGMIAPAALLLGPPLTFLTSIALLAGFVVLVLAPVSSWAAAVPAWVVHQSLSSCQWLVNLAERWPAHRWVGELPVWWVVVFYVALLAVLTHSTLRNRWRWVAPGGLGWLCLGLVMSAEPTRADELRCTFLAVGHGSAIVLELPDGRTILYDAGSMRGPDVTARIIAPFLWSRRIQRIDDVIVSHADLDHFNGLVDLADRFSIGRVLTSETFTHKDNRAVDVTLAEFRRRQIQHKVIRAGDRLVANSVTFNILHPPANYTAGNENARSLVVEVRHCERSILLTGDLEGVGLDHLLQTRPRKMDILQAPHHGSARLDIEGLIRWCKPALVVSCQGARRGMQHAEARYARDHVEFWTTHAQGAITVRSSAAGLQVEGYHDGKRWSAGGQQGR